MLTDRPARLGTSPPSLAGIDLGTKRAILERALAPAPSDRFETAGELWEALTSDMAGSATLAPAAVAGSRWAPEVRTNPTSMRPAAPSPSAPPADVPPSIRPQATTLDGEAETFFEVLPPPHLLAAIQAAIAGPPPPEPAPPPPAWTPAPAPVAPLDARREADWREHTRKQTNAVLVVVIVAVGAVLLIALVSVWLVTRSRSSLVLPMDVGRKEAGFIDFV
jgi:hypothetical protein